MSGEIYSIGYIDMLTIISVILTAVGLVIAYLMLKARKHKKRSWDQILRDLENLSHEIVKKQQHTELIISFSNGGLIAADLLHVKHFQNAPVVSVIVNRVNRGNMPQIVVTTPYKDNVFADKKILVIDDVLNTGQTLSAVVKYLHTSMGVKYEDLITAVLGLRKFGGGFKSTIYSFEYDSQVELPWGLVPRGPT